MIFFTVKHKKIRILGVLSGLSLAVLVNVLVSFANAQSTAVFEPTENIRLAAKIFLEEITNAADNPSISVNIGKLDPRLQLRQCNDHLQAFMPASSKPTGRVMVGISCSSPVLWKIFISATVDEFIEVVVARSNIAKKSLISEQDIEIKRVNSAKLRKQPATTKEQVINTSPKRFLRAGAVIFEDGICMVCRGDTVQISARNKYLAINLQGIALADATIGESTKVRNLQSKRSFNAKVVGKNQLEVTLAAVK